MAATASESVLYIATECSPYFMAGGIADVAGNLPNALKREGVDIQVVLPLYGSMREEFRSKLVAVCDKKVSFEGKEHNVRYCTLEHDGVLYNFIKDESFFEGNGYSGVYVNTPQPQPPFLDDTRRFAFFSKACLGIIEMLKPDIVHANDWMFGYLFGMMEKENMPQKRVLTIHNVAIQGRLYEKAIEEESIKELISQFGGAFRDPKYADCINPMRLAIELSDMVNTVGKKTCEEMTLPNCDERYFIGGDGLEEVLAKKHAADEFIGILNGCNYSDDELPDKKMFKSSFAGNFLDPDDMLIGFVSRHVDQKTRLLSEYVDGKTVLEHILDIPHVNMISIGSGETNCFMMNMAMQRYPDSLRYNDALWVPRRKNYFPIGLFDSEIGDRVIKASDLIVMPSINEPCGGVQLKAMANGTLPLVRRIGGLADTVDECCGFLFDGKSKEELKRNLIESVRSASELYHDNRPDWEFKKIAALEQRFTWDSCAKKYQELVYDKVLEKR